MKSSQNSRNCSPSLYSRPSRSPSPSRPCTPSSFECFLTLQGGRSSAVDVLPSNLQQTKIKRLTETEEYQRAIFDASYLKAENEWLRQSRKSAVELHEGAVLPVTESLALSANSIHSSLAHFHIGFAAVEQLIQMYKNPAAADVETTLQELIPAFEECRRGLDGIRAALIALENGGQKYSHHIQKSNKHYAGFFGISYDELNTTVSGARARRTQ
ncbi:uncharacterized protein BP01DRAFT_419674 [Aspergillus saccharolyticus JOP 1030-1]|uniref:Uncharacterized protein n=1 Tax=Aspergillus saccharolyticus JOP 1030-1 TaxID=1450539 RepID=A0A318ZIL9_9EURO|nr:hypothetical protein BP01DRAFT_419674 [Aspergillus saccharolyticus JOP 1030-1]PYH40088.1 hypothetical protein BP01DRAFT_419674 [Aspergillus saccharolyticus JOP 1030-1]